jgi:hypothetical protein
MERPSGMPRLHARTDAEAQLYMDLRPCSCGEVQFDRHASEVTEEGVLCSRYAGPCARCGQPREFVFEGPATPRPSRGDTVEFGGSEPSRLLDPGEWMMVALERAKRQPSTREDLAFARAAVEEVVKFLPAGAERVPDEAFTERGRALAGAEPGRFRRARLATTLQAWADILARYDGRPPDPTAPDPGPDPTAPSPEATELAAAVPAQVEQLLDAIAKTDTEAGRAIAARRAALKAE